ncbi:DDE-type integrase/transposase/recombinase [Burkholderia ubonensis]|uniref:DDE-type integrase/transposase/recombinase n=1 Tax=Burkholderia ubonensis TaxID=101571 RepID=UPI000AD39824|nr:DDE-type integrase/transposase/recombinase [Burkholderia ubonensis]
MALGCGDKWHLDGSGRDDQRHQALAWLAVDRHGALLEVLVQRRRDKAAAKRQMRKLLKRHGRPRVIVTDQLRSYAAAHTELGLNVKHRQHKGYCQLDSTPARPDPLHPAGGQVLRGLVMRCTARRNWFVDGLW